MTAAATVRERHGDAVDAIGQGGDAVLRVSVDFFAFFHLFALAVSTSEPKATPWDQTSTWYQCCFCCPRNPRQLQALAATGSTCSSPRDLFLCGAQRRWVIA